MEAVISQIKSLFGKGGEVMMNQHAGLNDPKNTSLGVSPTEETGVGF